MGWAILYISGGFINYFWVKIFIKEIENSYMEKKKKNILYISKEFIKYFLANIFIKEIESLYMEKKKEKYMN